MLKKKYFWNDRQSVEAVRKAVEIYSDWDTAESVDKLHVYILHAAQNMGRIQPYSADEVALNTYLADRMAGKRLCDYAWRIFAQGQ